MSRVRIKRAANRPPFLFLENRHERLAVKRRDGIVKNVVGECIVVAIASFLSFVQ